MHTPGSVGSTVKRRTDGRLYMIDHVIHSTTGVDADDVYACYQLSAYDGMPIGSQVWLLKSELQFTTDDK